MKMDIGRVAAAALLLGCAGASQAALLKSYDFDSGLTDTLGNGNALVASGGTVAGGRYTFAANQGLRLTSALPGTTDYFVEMRLRIDDSTVGYNKLLDFQDLGSDIGFYVLNGQLNFYTALGSAGPSIAVGADFIAGIGRSGTALTMYLNGAAVSTVANDGGQAVSGGNILNFFEDDLVTSQGETFAGSVDWIRIHDDASTMGQAPNPNPVPAPAPVALGALALLLAGARRMFRAA